MSEPQQKKTIEFFVQPYRHYANTDWFPHPLPTANFAKNYLSCHFFKNSHGTAPVGGGNSSWPNHWLNAKGYDSVKLAHLPPTTDASLRGLTLIGVLVQADGGTSNSMQFNPTDSNGTVEIPVQGSSMGVILVYSYTNSEGRSVLITSSDPEIVNS